MLSRLCSQFEELSLLLPECTGEAEGTDDVGGMDFLKAELKKEVRQNSALKMPIKVGSSSPVEGYLYLYRFADWDHFIMSMPVDTNFGGVIVDVVTGELNIECKIAIQDKETVFMFFPLPK